MTTTKQPAEGTPAVYQVALPLSAKTITFVADLLRGHLKAIGSRWRKLPAGKIAVIVLAVLRHDQRLADMAGGNDVSPATTTSSRKCATRVWARWPISASSAWTTTATTPS
ncbi:hypothetical protein [Streptosporangium sp. NPDC087985]|uniref:hypothetical protein n=1 Tax=Streptosporangium sp. NPDC087985 TaxID=3366196 RepID=UPI0038251C71